MPPLLRSEEHTSELQSLRHLVCRLLLEKKTSVILSWSEAHILRLRSWSNMLTSLLATSDLAREVALRRYADAGKLTRAPFRAVVVFYCRLAGCSRRFPIANWRQP